MIQRVSGYEEIQEAIRMAAATHYLSYDVYVFNFLASLKMASV